jgi:type VI secretion system protein ImpL
MDDFRMNEFLQKFLAELQERAGFLVDQTRGIWEDPLWMLLGIVALVVIAGTLLFWFAGQLRTGLDALAAITTGPVKKLVVLAATLVKAFLSWRKNHGKDTSQSFVKLLRKLRSRRLLEHVRSLTTRTDWCYQSPWYMVLGNQGSGKSTLVAGVRSGRKTQILLREKSLHLEGSEWHFFDGGTLIDVDGSLSTADPGTPSCKAWETLLDMVVGYRPERALDGIVLAISAMELLQAEDGPALERIGDRLYAQLWKIQKQTGFVLPVYALITQWDRVEGFEEFWKIQPESLRKGIVGWSNPNQLIASFSPEWIDEACNYLLDHLQAARLDLAARGGILENPDQVLLFPERCKRLHAPLRKVLSNLFGRTTYHENPPLRGVYFTGQLQGKNKSEQVFVDDLFRDKIFAERNLSHPVQSRFFSINARWRKVQVAAICAAVLLTILLGLDSFQLLDSKQNNTKILRTIGNHQPAPEVCDAKGSEVYWTLNVASMMRRPFYASMPLSWWQSDVDRLGHDLAEKALWRIVLPNFSCRLQKRARSLESWEDNMTLPSEPSQLADKVVRAYANVEEFYTNQDRFIELIKPGVSKQAQDNMVEDVENLLDYLYDTEVPTAVDMKNVYLRSAIAQVEYYVDWDNPGRNLISRQVVRKRLDEFSRHAYAKLFVYLQTPPIDSFSQNLGSSLAVPDARTVHAAPMLSTLDSMDQWMKSVQRNWMVLDSVETPCDRMRHAMERLTDSLVQRDYLRDELTGIIAIFDGATCMDKAWKTLQGKNKGLFAPLVGKDSLGHMRFSPGMEAFQRNIARVRHLSFLRLDLRAQGQDEDVIAGWNVAALQAALQATREYLQYRESMYKADSTKEVRIVNEHVLQHFQQVVGVYLRQAMVRESQTASPSESMAWGEEDLKQKVQAFQEAKPYLVQLSALLTQLGDVRNANFLLQETRNFANSSLLDIDDLVEQSGLYQTSDSPDWSKSNYTLALLGLSEDGDAGDYLDNHRQRLSYLAYFYAQPLVDYLQSTNDGTGLTPSAQRWWTTLGELFRFKNKDPNSEVTGLEHFVTSSLAKMNDTNCTQWVTAHTPATNSHNGWFAQALTRLDQKMRNRCEYRVEDWAVNTYLELAQRFNAQLAGRFPFATSNNKEADPSRVLDFFAEYPDSSRALTEAIRDMGHRQRFPQDAKLFASWAAFLDRLDTVYQFIQRTNPQAAGKWPVAMAVGFHAAPSLEVGTSQIVKWELRSQDQTLSYPNGRDTLDWSVGSALSLRLQWAQSSPYRPAKAPDGYAVSTDGNSAEFSAKGSWALLTLVREHGDFGAAGLRARLQGNTLLRFVVKVRTQDVSGKLTEPGEAAEAVAYIQLHAFCPGEKGDLQSVVIPQTFPVKAPLWE